MSEQGLAEALVKLDQQDAAIQNEHNETINTIPSLEAKMALMNPQGREINWQWIQERQDNRTLRRVLVHLSECYRCQLDVLWEEMSAPNNYPRRQVPGYRPGWALIGGR